MAFGIALCGAYYQYQYQPQTPSDSSIAAINSSTDTAHANGTDGPSPGKELNDTNNTTTNQSALTIPLEKPPFVE